MAVSIKKPMPPAMMKPKGKPAKKGKGKVKPSFAPKASVR